MKKPSQQEIDEEYNKVVNIGELPYVAFVKGIDFVLKYNEEQRDVLKIFNIGYEIDMVEILNIMENYVRK